jgi:hypothetical protein
MKRAWWNLWCFWEPPEWFGARTSSSIPTLEEWLEDRRAIEERP